MIQANILLDCSKFAAPNMPVFPSWTYHYSISNSPKYDAMNILEYDPGHALKPGSQVFRPEYSQPAFLDTP
jgi:hypothetical protein